MKKIEAIVRPEKLDDVKKALEKAGYPGMTISEVEGHGKQKGVTRQWRGESYKVDLLPKVKIEVVVSDKEAERILSAIASASKTGAVGDGKIFVTDIKDILRIRTGERGEDAL
ncbi:MAG: P-II family nitrogen regulator [Candidatus Omnitrophica bacterium]|nr:P-II family nitrogen regulator [Candidatus Omnitrophota bacterium]MBI2174189.1 P-II family nitrogen regulator [Candidatus Omnitrophota bacterium]